MSDNIMNKLERLSNELCKFKNLLYLLKLENAKLKEELEISNNVRKVMGGNISNLYKSHGKLHQENLKLKAEALISDKVIKIACHDLAYKDYSMGSEQMKERLFKQARGIK